jgi:hypothetical protein
MEKYSFFFEISFRNQTFETSIFRAKKLSQGTPNFPRDGQKGFYITNNSLQYFLRCLRFENIVFLIQIQT